MKPFNADKARSAFRVASTKPLVVRMGGNTIIECPVVLQIHGEPIVSVRRESDQILFSVKLFDKDDNMQFQMIDNLWEANTELFDLRYSENQGGAQVWISVKMKGSDPYTELRLIQDELHIKGKFYRRGHLIDSRDDGIFEADRILTLGRVTIEKFSVAIEIG